MIQKVVILMGPTGAGKSALALALAQQHGGEIVNADSRQIYLGMDIGTDKMTLQRHPEPRRRISVEDRDSSAEFTLERSEGPQNDRTRSRETPLLIEGVPHYLIDILPPGQRYSAAEFRDNAQQIIADIHRRGKLPIVVGGTGFYLRVLTGDQPLPNVPPDPAFRAWAETQPLAALVRELHTTAPDRYARVDNLRNRRRVTRSLEVARARGRRQQAEGSGARGTAAGCPPVASLLLKLALIPPPETLRQRIEARVDSMLARGFLDEIRQLVAAYGADAPGLQAVGYRDVLPLLQSGASATAIRAALMRAHWTTARRQQTWLKKEPALRIATTPDHARALVETFVRGRRARRK